MTTGHCAAEHGAGDEELEEMTDRVGCGEHIVTHTHRYAFSKLAPGTCQRPSDGQWQGLRGQGRAAGITRAVSECRNVSTEATAALQVGIARDCCPGLPTSGYRIGVPCKLLAQCVTRCQPSDKTPCQTLRPRLRAEVLASRSLCIHERALTPRRSHHVSSIQSVPRTLPSLHSRQLGRSLDGIVLLRLSTGTAELTLRLARSPSFAAECISMRGAIARAATSSARIARICMTAAVPHADASQQLRFSHPAPRRHHRARVLCGHGPDGPQIHVR